MLGDTINQFDRSTAVHTSFDAVIRRCLCSWLIKMRNNGQEGCTCWSITDTRFVWLGIWALRTPHQPGYLALNDCNSLQAYYPSVHAVIDGETESQKWICGWRLSVHYTSIACTSRMQPIVLMFSGYVACKLLRHAPYAHTTSLPDPARSCFSTAYIAMAKALPPNASCVHGCEPPRVAKAGITGGSYEPLSCLCIGLNQARNILNVYLSFHDTLRSGHVSNADPQGL